MFIQWLVVLINYSLSSFVQRAEVSKTFWYQQTSNIGLSVRYHISPTIYTILNALEDDTVFDDEMEDLFLKLAQTLLDTPMPARVMGLHLKLHAVDSTPRGRGLRARVVDHEGISWQVNLDSLEFSSDSIVARMVALYRYWLGYDRLDHKAMARIEVLKADGQRVRDRFASDQSAPPVVQAAAPVVSADAASNATEGQATATQAPQSVPAPLDPKVRQRVAVLRKAIEDAGNTLAELDYDEMLQWLYEEDDHYWGHDRRSFRSEDAQEYLRLMRVLGALPGKIEGVWGAGAKSEAAGLIVALMESLFVATFEEFCPEELRTVVLEALQAWLRVAPDTETPDAVMSRFGGWFKAFDLFSGLDDALQGLPSALEPAAISWLEETRTSSGFLFRECVSILCNLRMARGELESFVERIPISEWSSEDVLLITKHLDSIGQGPRALKVVNVWLESSHRHGADADVGAHRRALMRSMGNVQEVLDELWSSYNKRPSARLFEEIRVFGDDAMIQRAVDKVARDVTCLLDFARHSDPGPDIARLIGELSVKMLKAQSSWTLQDVAKHLDENHPQAAAKVYVALGWRHVDRGKAQYYHLGIEAFKRARELYYALGLEERWRQLTLDVEAEHSRKYSFMPRFKALGR